MAWLLALLFHSFKSNIWSRHADSGVSLFGNSKLPTGVNASVNGCLCELTLQQTSISCPIAAEIRSGPTSPEEGLWSGHILNKKSKYQE